MTLNRSCIFCRLSQKQPACFSNVGSRKYIHLCTNVGNKGGQKNNYSVKYSKNLPSKYSNKAFVLGCPYLPLFTGHGSAGLQGPERAGAAGCQLHQTGREAAGSASRNPEGGAQELWSESAHSRNTTRSTVWNHQRKTTTRPRKLLFTSWSHSMKNTSTFVYYACI